ncbi:MAG: DAK2 domain-containing protein [Ruminococcaceae bacterium]|nr:DAK2 domain-containing protein [Oscillospiraceae bacterium]
MREYIDAAVYRDIILNANAVLENNIQLINELNVFPVPDGDTGTNMSLTMGAAAEAISGKQYDSLGSISDSVASAMLRGARGNSGVILSLLFRGIAKRLKGQETADTKLFSAALSDGVDAAYKAVMKPAEGTILTVSRVATSSAIEFSKNGSDLELMISCALESAEEALADTINLNPVLAKAGVVDAGGKGYVFILEAMLSAIAGKLIESKLGGKVKEGTHFDVFSSEEIEFAYDTVFIVRKTGNTELSSFRTYLESIGDSLVMSEDDNIFKVHVHTNIPGTVLLEAANYGVLEKADIENMRTQHDELVAGRAHEEEAVFAPATKPFGVVAVCAGEGLEGIFRELGVDTVVTGGQTMNPSTADILAEINKTPAETVFVLPNNKNIIMAADQCVPLTEKKVVVVPSKTVPQGISALISFDDSCTEEEIVAAMREATESVHTALITYAARDSEFDGHTIHAGEYLMLLDGSLIGSFSNIETLFRELSWSIDELSPAVISIYYGEDTSEEEAQKAGDWLGECFPDAEISIVNGGQPVYHYMISVE